MNCPPYAFQFHHGKSLHRRVGNLVAHYLSTANHRSLYFFAPGLVHNLQSRARQNSAYHRDSPVIIEIDSLPTTPCLCQDVKNRAEFVKIDCVELYYVRLPLEDTKPGFFSDPPYFTPWKETGNRNTGPALSKAGSHPIRKAGSRYLTSRD